MGRSDRLDPNSYRGFIFRTRKAETLQTTVKQKNRTRRMVTRVAVAGALAVVPLTALTVPAFADTPPAVAAVDRDNHHPGHPGDRGPGEPGRDDHHQQAPAPSPQLPLPSTGSAG